MDMISNTALPSDWTSCEVYRGYIIAIKCGIYKAFRGPSGTSDISSDCRSCCRAMIDNVIFMEAV